jgi:hypothetical protein
MHDMMSEMNALIRTPVFFDVEDPWLAAPY